MAAASSKKSKTSRFPVARIKKIMQMDEEVGKLASATPVMISKSIECFLQTLLAEATNEASKRGNKKLTAYHLKTTINQNDTFDFLREIVSTIPDPTESETPTQGGRKPRAKAQSQSQSQSHSRPGTSAAGAGYGGETIPESKPESMPDIGTWKKEGGTGEGGRGMFDDYEDDEDY